MTEKVASGFTRCETCGEFNGTTDAVNLSSSVGFIWTGKVTVTCLCSGVPCLGCRTHLVHAPAMNSYDAESNSIRRWPSFGGEMLCRECRSIEASETKKRVIDVDAPLNMDADVTDLARAVGMKEAAKLGAKFVEVPSDGGTRYEVELYGRHFGPMSDGELLWFLIALTAKPSKLPDFHAEASDRSSEIKA